MTVYLTGYAFYLSSGASEVNTHWSALHSAFPSDLCADMLLDCFLRFYFELCVNVYVSMCGYVRVGAVTLEASSNSLGAQVIGSHKPPYKGTGNQIQDLWKSNGHS